MIRAVLFDMDGVLFDTERLGSELSEVAAKLQGCSLDNSSWNSLIGLTMKETADRLAAWCPGMDVKRFSADWREVMLRHVQTYGMPFKPGARELIPRLKENGILLGLCSSNDPVVVHEYLRIAGWKDAFDTVITVERVQRAKPAPDMYLTAAADLCAGPEECAGVEDSPSGIRAVRAAGMLSVMVPDVVPFSDALAPAVDLLIPSLNDFESAVWHKEEIL